ncbi:MAG: protease complex subunit PrcB family protein [Lachnospiraceae bacterium]|nr:protease complex subunit PrcB family protein [Lachnospiraceae bacterium]
MKRWIIPIVLVIIAAIMSGCGLLNMEKVKLRDLEFVIVSEELIPAELKTIIDERKQEEFKLTFADADALYICVGYGQQKTGGFSITVDELYLTEKAIYAETTLLGPDSSEKVSKAPSYPYIVIKTEALDETVICE